MRYEDVIRKICGDDWRTVSREEREGGYGVACVIGVMRNVKANPNDLASHLGVAPDELFSPFNRLARQGAFTRWNLKRDRALAGQLGDEETQRAWAHVAAVASGFIGV